MLEKEQRTCAAGIFCKIVIKRQARIFNAFLRFCMPYILARWQNNQTYAPTTDFYLNQLFERIHNIFETYSNSAPSPWCHGGATPVGRQHRIPNNLRRDGLTICISCCRCCRQLHRTNLQNIFCETGGGQEFTGARFNLALASFRGLECLLGAEDTCTSWPFQGKVVNISQATASCFFKLMYN